MDNVPFDLRTEYRFLPPVTTWSHVTDEGEITVVAEGDGGINSFNMVALRTDDVVHHVIAEAKQVDTTSRRDSSGDLNEVSPRADWLNSVARNPPEIDSRVIGECLCASYP